MLKTVSKALASVALMALATTSMAEKGEQWLTDMDEAQKIAKAEGKDIFMFFTGSDWCGWCIKLDNEVLSKDEFLDYAEDNLVLVDLDFPNGEDIITEEQREHNEKWQEVFKPRGFPSIYLTDASANAYALTGYQAGGPEKYVEHLTALREGKAASAALAAKAEKASGLERAKLLDEILGNQNAVITDRGEKEAEIMTLTEGKDADLYNKYRGIKGGKDMMGELRGLHANKASDEEVLEKMQAIYKKYNFIKEGMALHQLLGMTGDQFIKTGKTEEGVKFMDSVKNDESLAMDVRQAVALFKGIITANDKEPNIELAMKFCDETIAMDPEGQAAQRAKTLKQSLSQQAEKSDK